MKSKEDIEKLLEGFGKAWPEGGSIAESVMRKIESAPVRPNLSKRMRIMMKSIIAIAASAAIFAAIWWGAIDNQKSLYAQVMEAVKKARTLHVVSYWQAKSGAELQKKADDWLERGVGFRAEAVVSDRIDVGNNEGEWTFSKGLNTAYRYKSHGEHITNGRVFQYIDQIVQRLQDEYERYPAGDKAIDGMPCKAYRMNKYDRYGERLKAEFTSGKTQWLKYIDQQSRLVRSENQIKENDQWKTRGFESIAYDEPLDQALFQPNFGKDVKIIDTDKNFDEFVDLKKAIYTEKREGLIFAIHRVELFENGGLMYVYSVRGTEEMLKTFPVPIHKGSDSWKPLGPAVEDSSHNEADGLHKKLAGLNYQGIDMGWWAIIPRNAEPNSIEAAPGKINLHISVKPSGEFRKSLTERQIDSLETGWNIAIASPQSGAVSTVEDIAKSTYADLKTLVGISQRYLFLLDEDHREKKTYPRVISSAEYAEKMVMDIAWEYKHAANSQTDGQPETKK